MVGRGSVRTTHRPGFGLHHAASRIVGIGGRGTEGLPHLCALRVDVSLQYNRLAIGLLLKHEKFSANVTVPALTSQPCWSFLF